MTKDLTQAHPGATSVLIGHRYLLFGASLACLLEKSAFHVVDLATSNESLIDLAHEHKPDILLLDWKIKGINVQSLRQLTASLEHTAIAVLVDPDAVQEFFPAMDAGVSGYLSKNIDEGKLVASLQLIARGEVVLSREIATSLSDEGKNGGHSHDQLTEREVQVLGMVGTGATNKEIAESLIITENTVKVHLRNILDKLNLRNRQQAAAYAAEQGIKADLPEDLVPYQRQPA